ncbi:MAG: oligosaccharide flippase family protein [Methylococcaceae bacterium]|nr:oligosaccharide flippase family protein [Methylococcaceae bacterium]
MSDNPYSGSAVKRSAGHFLVGKIVSALLTFTILLWLVRLLNVPDYATYVTLAVSLDMTLFISGIGLPWMESRYLPEFRLHASKTILIRFIVQLIQSQVALLLLVAISAWLCLDWLLLKMNMTAYSEVVQLCLIMLVVDGTGRRLRDSTLSALLQQGLAQISLVIRNLLFIIALAILVYSGEVSLIHVITADLLAASVSLLISLVGLWRHLKRINISENPNWIAPKWSQMWAVARNMYFSSMVTQAYSSQVFTLIIRYNLGVEATAAFGFLRNLYSQVTSYLPATLLFGLIRPKLIASYVGDGGIVELTRNANIIGKFSLFVLMPLLVFAWLTGEQLVAQLSGGKFTQSGYYLAGILCAAIPLSQRQILETVAVLTGNSHLCNYASLLGILTLPMAYGLIQIGFDLWAPIIATALGNLLFCSTIAKGVTKNTLYHADLLGYYKMLLAALLGYLASMLIIFPAQGWVSIIAIAILACCAFLLAAAIIKPFSETERLRINQLIKRNLFIW